MMVLHAISVLIISFIFVAGVCRWRVLNVDPHTPQHVCVLTKQSFNTYVSTSL